MNEEKTNKLKGLTKILMLPATEKQLEAMLDDLLTDSEIDKVHERICIIGCLKKGLSQRKTQIETQAGIATVSRGARLLKNDGREIYETVAMAQKKPWWRKLFYSIHSN